MTTAELTSMIREVTTLQARASRQAFLATLSPAALYLLKAHFATYGPQFPDGTLIVGLINDIALDAHAEMSIAVIADFQAGKQ